MKKPLTPDGPWRQPDYGAMQTAVAGVQQQRATVAGPPVPLSTRPVDMSEGVEQKARARREMAGPQQPQMINGVQRYAPKLPGSDIGGAPTDAATPAAVTPTLPAAATPRMAPPLLGSNLTMPSASPLGGMDSRPLSERGPMRGPVGVGTTNPNAVPVGRGRRDVGTRTLERLARRGDVRAAGVLAGQTFQSQQTADNQGFTMTRDRVRRADEMTDYQVRRGDVVADRASEQTYQNQRDAEQNQRRDAERTQGREWQTQDQQAEWAREDTAKANDSIVGDATIPVVGGNVPAVRTKGGNVRMAGGFIPTPKAAPDMSAIQNDPNLRIKTVDSTGKAVYERIDDKGNDPVIEWVKGEGLTGGQVPYQRKIDPQTGEVTFHKVRVIDANGDGVVTPAEKAAAAAPKPAADAAAAPNQTASGIKYKLKA